MTETTVFDELRASLAESVAAIVISPSPTASAGWRAARDHWATVISRRGFVRPALHRSKPKQTAPCGLRYYRSAEIAPTR